jgi:Ca2+-transporting ATPase
MRPPGGDAHRRWHALHAEEALAAVGSNAQAGLSRDEASERLRRFGPNALPEPRRRSLASIFLGQFRSPLIYLLLAAAGLALALGHTNDAAVIAAVVLLNASIGFFHEGRAERSLEALRKLAAHRARVLRDGREEIVDASELVPGDVLVLEAGDAVAADARLLDGAALQIAEAALTGESAPVAKELLPLAPDTPLADRRNMVFAGTHVAAGRGRALVVGTGLATEIGHIASLTEVASQPETPLERRIAGFGRAVIAAASVMFVLVVGVGHARGIPFAEILMVAVSQLVGMVPEGLPVAMTIALAVGVQRMARRNAVVRRLAAVETLGSTTVVCTDKTGTLTRNEMTATALWLPDGPELAVSGVGYEPAGRIGAGVRAPDASADAALRELLEAAVLCNDAQLRGPGAAGEGWQPIGDPTEAALLALGIKGGLLPDELRGRRPRRAEIPFDPAAKMMATQHEADGASHVIVKGAPEVVLDLCAAGDAARERAREAAEAMAARALRVLAFARIETAAIDGRTGFDAFRRRARLLGLVGQIDPPRPEVRDAVARCRDAGVRPVMVTGDHRATGRAIALELGIAGPGDAAVDGRELEAMSDAELVERVASIAVFARVHPAQKLRIVAAHRSRGEVVAMTGDGVNDAPALVEADVGVAMGRSGTEVAKEAAEIVIGDDNFATIVAAVEEGRVVHRNVKKAILYLISTSLAHVVVLFVALLLGYPPPLAAVQILWINLVTEGTVTVNLVMEPAEGDEMRSAPTPARERLLSPELLRRMAFMTPAIAASTLGWFTWRLSQGVPFPQVQTETFTVLAVCQWFNVLNCRSEQHSAFDRGLLRNRWLIGALVASNLLHAAVVFLPPLNRVFHTVPIDLTEVFAIGAVASLVLWVEEARKLVARRRAR